MHFPIALYIVSVGLDTVGRWKRNSNLVAAGAINLALAGTGAILSLGTGILAWQLKFGGMALNGNLLFHLVGALTSTTIIWSLILIRRKAPPGLLYFVLAAVGIAAVAVTGHLGGMLSGVAG